MRGEPRHPPGSFSTLTPPAPPTPGVAPPSATTTIIIIITPGPSFRAQKKKPLERERRQGRTHLS